MQDRRVKAAAGVLIALLVTAGALALLIRGARPDHAASASVLELPASGLSPKCVRTARDGASLARQYAAASPGQTICLRSGDYGTFTAGRKLDYVGVRPAPEAKVEMKLAFASVAGLRLDGVTIASADIGGDSRNITIANSRFTGPAVVDATQFDHANVVFDHNIHANIDTCQDCAAGRLMVGGNNGRPSGVTIKNSIFSGGNSDGVRPDADAVQVIGNQFYGFRDEDPFHTDPVQIYGGTHTVIRGNYFHDNAVSAQIMIADGGVGNVIEDNVISGDGYVYAITLYADDGSIIRHNTFQTGHCGFNVRCGTLNLGTKPGQKPGKGTVIRDNILGGIGNGGEGGASGYIADHNLTRAPRFRGPEDRYSGYRLRPGSPGVRRASDGRNLGIR